MKTRNAFSRAASSVRRAFSRITHRGSANQSEPERVSRPSTAEPLRARPKKIQTDIPLDRLDQAYTPTQTSLKTSFRSDGADQQRDQEFALGTVDERWNDEDRLTNKSGDPRIGTHGRTYEPGERRAK
jgi:hypothetical protein